MSEKSPTRTCGTFAARRLRLKIGARPADTHRRPEETSHIGAYQPLCEVFGSGFKPTLSLEERVAGLSRFWAEVKFAFPYFNRRPEIDWDALYLEYLPKVIQARSTFEYYQMLQRLCALLRDGHTNVYFPKELMETEFVKPPLRTGLIGGKVLILEIPSAALRSQGLKVGDEIVAVDGAPVRA